MFVYMSCLLDIMGKSVLFHEDFLLPFLNSGHLTTTLLLLLKRTEARGKKEYCEQGQGLVRVCYRSMVQKRINKY